jgi:hypothetical protein
VRRVYARVENGHLDTGGAEGTEAPRSRGVDLQEVPLTCKERSVGWVSSTASRLDLDRLPELVRRGNPLDRLIGVDLLDEGVRTLEVGGEVGIVGRCACNPNVRIDGLELSPGVFDEFRQVPRNAHPKLDQVLATHGLLTLAWSRGSHEQSNQYDR